ncbi:hypothetical protein GCM10010121_052440 [Streptomyces brasiliensis]|uniref:Uncharacterized protein n=1 Tax=Streptomyces brasiliensis TaxID=1954 RepID=A0A917KZU9_9ACTN|nr:hypothetical protein GCM10010121_052440 [Streptomyces brasiliensis]
MPARVPQTGSLNGRDWSQVWPLLGAVLVLVPLLLWQGRGLALLELGDDTARALGVPVERTRLVAVLAAVLLTAVATAAAGPVSLVALTAPQLARRLTRGSGPQLLPAAAMGALLLVGADWAAQRAFGSVETSKLFERHRTMGRGLLRGATMAGLPAAEAEPRSRPTDVHRTLTACRARCPTDPSCRCVRGLGNLRPARRPSGRCIPHIQDSVVRRMPASTSRTPRRRPPRHRLRRRGCLRQRLGLETGYALSAVDLAVPLSAITTSLFARFSSRQDDSPQ